MDDQRRPPFDAHPVVFAAKQSSRVCASDEKIPKESYRRERKREGRKIRRRMANSVRRIVAALFLRLYVRRREAQSREEREIKTRMIGGDRRSKEVHAREDNVMNKMKFGGFPEAIRLSTLGIIVERKKRRKRVNKSHTLRALGRNCLYRILLCTFITPLNFSKNEL